MGHGSRDDAGAREFLALVEAVQRAAASYRVTGGLLEFARDGVPSIQEAFDAIAASGAGTVVAAPVLLFHAGHDKQDMPAQAWAAARRYPQLEIRLAPNLGIHPLLLEIAEERLAALEARAVASEPEATAVLLVGRGTSDPEANGDFFKAGRLVWERNNYALVECAFVSLAEPGVAAGIRRCVALGATRVLVLPYFLNTGVLVQRIHQQARETAMELPGVQVLVGEHLGVHPKLVELILQRAAEATAVSEAPGVAAAAISS